MKGDGSLIKEYSVVALQGLTLVLFIFFMWVASRGMKSLKIVGSVAGCEYLSRSSCMWRWR